MATVGRLREAMAKLQDLAVDGDWEGMDTDEHNHIMARFKSMDTDLWEELIAKVRSAGKGREKFANTIQDALWIAGTVAKVLA